MTFTSFQRVAFAALASLALVSCGTGGAPDREVMAANGGLPAPSARDAERAQSNFFDLFRGSRGTVSGNVNSFLWQASLDTLDFLPIQSVDPFTGVIVFGVGTPPGGGGSYRATVYVTDAALAARSLNVSLMTASGAPVAEGTQRAVEDAILTRARQLRVEAGRF